MHDCTVPDRHIIPNGKRMPGSNMKNCIILYISSTSDRDLFRIAPDRRMIPYSWIFADRDITFYDRTFRIYWPDKRERLIKECRPDVKSGRKCWYIMAYYLAEGAIVKGDVTIGEDSGNNCCHAVNAKFTLI